MRWLSPTALFGLLALAVPILVHIFGRRLARRQRFPTLRLLKDTLPRPTTRSRPSDLVLLLLRCAVIVAAVLGLAQPIWSTASRSRSAQQPARAIVVDTSASMQRLTSGDTTAVDQARSLARRMLDSARSSLLIETDDPGQQLAGAASWLQSRAGARELVVVSDFQRGAVEEGQLAAVPRGIGVRFTRVAAAGAPAVMDDRSVVALRVSAQLDGTSATWIEPAVDTRWPFAVLAAKRDSDAVHAASNAARVVHVSSDSTRDVAVVFPSYETRQGLVAGAGSLDAPWQGDLLHRLTHDSLLRAVSTSARVLGPCPVIGAPIARNVSGEVVATIARAGAGADHEVLVFACVEPGTLAASAILASVATAVDPAPDFGELEPAFVPDEELRRWERPATEIAPPSPDDSSDGRWFWLTAIALLLIEELVRRSPRVRQRRAVTEVSRERVA